VGLRGGFFFIYVPGERPAASRAGLFPRSPSAVGWMIEPDAPCLSRGKQNLTGEVMIFFLFSIG
jgi:hypothetical protein